MRKEEKKTWISRSSSADKKEVKERDLRKKSTLANVRLLMGFQGRRIVLKHVGQLEV